MGYGEKQKLLQKTGKVGLKVVTQDIKEINQQSHQERLMMV